MNFIKHGKMSAIIAVSFYSISVLSTPVMAQAVNTSGLSKSTKKKQPVDIESDKMEIIDKENKAVFVGKVKAVRGDTTLNSDKLVVDFIKEKNKKGKEKTVVTFLYATGHVLIITKKQRITGQWARMNVRKDTAVVGGNVIVHQGATIVKGKKLNINLKTNRSEMTGGRVKGSFVPK